jgi:hypothetical protein
MKARVITIMEWFMEFSDNFNSELEGFTQIKYNNNKKVIKTRYGDFFEVGGIKFIRNGIEVLNGIPKTKNLVLVTKDYKFESRRLKLLKEYGPFNFYLIKARKKINVKVVDRLGYEISYQSLYFKFKEGKWELLFITPTIKS